MQYNTKEQYANNVEQIDIKSSRKLTHTKLLDYQMSDLYLKLEVKIALLKSEMLKWFIGVSLVQTSTFIATILTAVKFFIKN